MNVYALGKQAAGPGDVTQPMKAVKQVERGVNTKALRNTVVKIIKDLMADKAKLSGRAQQLLKQRKLTLGLGIPGAIGGAGLSYYLGRRAGQKE